MNNRPKQANPSPRPASRATPLPQGEREKLICVGQIGAPHGVRGEVRLRSFTGEPQAIAAYGPLQTEDGRSLEIASMRPAKEGFVATFAGISDRDAAAELTNARLYVARDKLPEPEPDEFYHADLIGLAVVDASGTNIGTVVALHNFGAGDLIEVQLDSSAKTELIAFDERHVPVVDIAAGKIVVDASIDAPQTPPPVRGRSTAKRSGRR